MLPASLSDIGSYGHVKVPWNDASLMKWVGVGGKLSIFFFILNQKVSVENYIFVNYYLKRNSKLIACITVL